jgi:hypothetical protein
MIQRGEVPREHFGGIMKRQMPQSPWQHCMSNISDSRPTTGASGEPDPIVAAIERHRAALPSWLAAYDRLGVLQQMIPLNPEAPSHWMMFHERPDDCTDPPEWIEANTILLAAVDETANALEVVLSTPPTTVAGAADLLDYVCSHTLIGTTILEEAFCGSGYAPISVRRYLAVRNAAANFLRGVAGTLPRRPTGKCDPISAVIKRHEAAMRNWVAAMDRRWSLPELPETPRRWVAGEKPNSCTDEPEWIAANEALIKAYEELDSALKAVISTPPTTIAGVADLLDYVSREEWEVACAGEESGSWNGTILENALTGYEYYRALVPNRACVIEGVRKAAANFPPMIAATLRLLMAAPS